MRRNIYPTKLRLLLMMARDCPTKLAVQLDHNN